MKSLGARRSHNLLRPGDLLRGAVRVPDALIHSSDDAGEEDSDDRQDEDKLPPFEPLVLWTDPADPEHIVQVD